MTFSTFVKKYHLRETKLCGEQIVPGKFGHIYRLDNTDFAVLIMPDEESLMEPTGWWPKIRRRLVNAKFIILLDCEDEGNAAFSPDEPEQVKLALTAIGYRKRASVSVRKQRKKRKRRINRTSR